MSNPQTAVEATAPLESNREHGMNKQLTVERLFSLGDYQNIKFTDSIEEIPEVIFMNPEASRYLRYLQLVDIEWAYLNYLNLRKRIPTTSAEEAMEFIETERTRTFEELFHALEEKREE